MDYRQTKVSVRIPATTANVGPGFDSLGIALQLYNHVDLSFSEGCGIILSSGTSPEQNHGAIKMIRTAARIFFHKIKSKERGLKVHIHGEIPIARGLGSSVTVRLGILAGLNRLFGNPLKKDEILNLAVELEGHPDNAAAAMYGGFVVSGKIGKKALCFRKKISKRLKFITMIPDYEVETKRARALLPNSLPFSDAAQNVGRTALLVAAFWNEDYEAVGDFLEDRLHQPYRARLVPQLFSCLKAAKKAGAIGGWLSGSGSTMIAMTSSNHQKVARAMRKVFEDSGVSVKTLVIEADHKGLTFV